MPKRPTWSCSTAAGRWRATSWCVSTGSARWPARLLVESGRRVTVNRSILTLGLLLLLGSVWLVLSFPPGSGEFTVSLISLAAGAVLVAIAITSARRNTRRAPDKEDQ